MQQELCKIESQIKKIKRELQTIELIRPGSLTKQYKQPTEKKGAYYHISYTLDMKSHTDYVRKESINDANQQIKNYKRLRGVTKQVILHHLFALIVQQSFAPIVHHPFAPIVQH
jgi:hypothetical protein